MIKASPVTKTGKPRRSSRNRTTITKETARAMRARPGAGRAKGTPNKFTTIKNAVLEAFQELGGKDYLVRHGKFDFRTMSTMLNKAMPTEIQGNLNMTHEQALKELDE
jgi:hypothetical protein